MEKKLILVASPPASGKTYVSQRLAEALGQTVCLDKDDLCDLLRAGFAAAGEEVDMDGAFYGENLRAGEYATLLHLGFASLRHLQQVLVCAPFGKEIRDTEYMRRLKARANEAGADLVVIWVWAPPALCRQRMAQRASDRDTRKLEDWESYAQSINYTPPYELKNTGAVDRFMVFDNRDAAAMERSLNGALLMLQDEEF